MSPLIRHLSTYAAYHRDRRNVATHMIGIPLIVLAVAVLTSRPTISLGSVAITPAYLLSALAALFYLRLDMRFGLVMGALLIVADWAGIAAARLPTPIWAAIGLGMFVAGWAMQFIGHAMEGRKPAFLDDLRGLIVGPLFVVVEIAFLLGLRPDLREKLEHASG